MKELHLIGGGDAGGAKTHVLTLVQREQEHSSGALAALGEGALSDAASAKGIAYIPLSGGFFRSLRAVRALLADGEYAALHCHGSRANLTGALLRGRIPCPVVTTIHSDHRLDYLGRPGARLVYGTLNSLSLRRMDALFCVSDEMRSVYASRGFPREKLFSIYNGVDFSRPLSAMRKNRAAWFSARGFSVSEDAVLVGAVLRPSPVKDLPTLLRGFSSAREKDSRLTLALAGISPEALRDVGSENLDGVLPLGWVEDMDAFYASVDFLALTSRSETFPYALTDGARYSLPAVASAVGGVPSLVRHGETGLLFPAGDDGALAEGILRLAGDTALRLRLGEAARERAERLFSLEATVKREEELISLVSRKRRRVMISGAYGLGNTGDEAIAEAIVTSLRSADPAAAVTLLTRAPGETAARLDVDTLSPFRFARFFALARRADVFLSGGGNLLQDCTSRRSLRYYLFTLRAAKACGARVILWGVGLGPLSERGWRETIRTLNACADKIVFREERSLAEAREHGLSVQNVSVAADPALSLPPVAGKYPRAALSLREGAEYMAIALRGAANEDEALRVAGLCVRYARERGLVPLFLPMNPRRDGELSERAVKCFGGELVSPAVAADPERVRALPGEMRFTVSSRLHALVFSAAAGVPFLGVGADGRISAFCESVSMPWRRAEDLPDADALAALAESAEERRDELSARVKTLCETLREAEKSVFGAPPPEV